jgi:hypothetical protein
MNACSKINISTNNNITQFLKATQAHSQQNHLLTALIMRIIMRGIQGIIQGNLLCNGEFVTATARLLTADSATII